MSLRQKFDEANTSLDGHLTLEQARAAGMTQIVKNFGVIDAGGKGYVELAQVKAFKITKKASVEKAKTAKAVTEQRAAKRRALVTPREAAPG